MVFPLSMLVLLAAAVLVSSIGFKNYVWFISLEYGFSIAAEGLAMLLLFRGSLSAARCCAACCSSSTAAAWVGIWPTGS